MHECKACIFTRAENVGVFYTCGSLCVMECNTRSRGIIRRHLSEGEEETVCTGRAEILEPLCRERHCNNLKCFCGGSKNSKAFPSIEYSRNDGLQSLAACN